MASGKGGGEGVREGTEKRDIGEGIITLTAESLFSVLHIEEL